MELHCKDVHVCLSVGLFVVIYRKFEVFYEALNVLVYSVAGEGYSQSTASVT